MPRTARQYNEFTKVYHVILRGIDRQDIFLDEQDKKKWIKELINTKEQFNYDLYCYCLMNNHVHMVLYDKNMQLSKIIQSLAIRYATYFNKKYERVGHLFQNRFLSKNVEDAQYLMNVCRYIHQNPYQIGIKNFKDYEWSSYHEYIKGEIVVDTKMLMKTFENSKDNFEKFHQLNLYKNEIEDEIEYEIIEKLSDEEVKKYMQNILKLNNIYEILDYSVQKRNENLVKLANIKNVSLAQIARVLGINKKIVERVIKIYKASN